MMSEPRPMFAGLMAPRPRSRIEYGQGETTIHLRVPRNLGSILFQVFFLVIGGAAALFVTLLISAGSGEPAFLQIWMVGWTFGLLFVLFRLLWTIFGREKLIARNEGLTIARSILFVPWKHFYSIDDVGRMRFIANDPARSVRINGRIIPQPAIGIIARGYEVKLAHGISEPEANQVIEALRQRLVPLGRRKLDTVPLRGRRT